MGGESLRAENTQRTHKHKRARSTHTHTHDTCSRQAREQLDDNDDDDDGVGVGEIECGKPQCGNTERAALLLQTQTKRPLAQIGARLARKIPRRARQKSVTDKRAASSPRAHQRPLCKRRAFPSARRTQGEPPKEVDLFRNGQRVWRAVLGRAERCAASCSATCSATCPALSCRRHLQTSRKAAAAAARERERERKRRKGGRGRQKGERFVRADRR